MDPAPDPLLADAGVPRPDPDRLCVVALSGGVDSAVAAGLLVAAGHRVIGMTMRLYDARGTSAARGRCCGPRDIEDARRVAEHLAIPFYVVDLEDEFRQTVVDDFVTTYLAGATPNPCVRCNQHVKFTPLLERARAVGADVLVTGHYARIGPGPDGAAALHRGADPDKDQSYFLFSMPRAALPSVWFPLGATRKDDVRRVAARLGLPNAVKPESQEICFVPDGDHAGFVAAAALRRGQALPAGGDIVDQGGRVLGRHDGTHRFTIGQHRGLGNLATRERMFVTAVEPAAGRVVVGPRAAALRRAFTVDDVRWLGPVGDPMAVQVRHRGERLAATVVADGERAFVRISDEGTVAAPGQAAVFYDGERVVGGGWISAASA